MIADRFADVYSGDLESLFDTMKEMLQDTAFRRPPLLAVTSQI
jgi:hypothetical protein